MESAFFGITESKFHSNGREEVDLYLNYRLCARPFIRESFDSFSAGDLFLRAVQSTDTMEKKYLRYQAPTWIQIHDIKFQEDTKTAKMILDNMKDYGNLE